MKKIVSAVVMISCLGWMHDADAAGAYTCTRSTTPPSGTTAPATVTGCTGTITSYYVTYNGGVLTAVIGHCSACGTGYNQTNVQASDIAGVNNVCSNADSMVQNIKTCTAVAQTCTNCNSDTSWIGITTGYYKKTTRTCNNGTCEESTAYQCAQGYYGSPTSGTSGCTQCPTYTGVYKTAARTQEVIGYSAQGTTARTGCMILPGTYYDDDGTFELTDSCSYRATPPKPSGS